MKKTIFIEEEPKFKISQKSGREVCTIIEFGVHYVAFGETAMTLYSNTFVGDKIQVEGYIKSFTWKDANGDAHYRDDFVIQKWDKMG